MIISPDRLNELFSKYDSLKIALVGDLFLDRWYEIDPALDEPSLETGKTAWQIVKKRSAPGAGGTVLNNLSAMRIGRLEAISFVGEDGDGWELIKHLEARHVGTSGVIVSPEVVTPAYIKPLFPEEGNRLDIKNFRPTPEGIQRRLIELIERAAEEMDALILLDQVCEADCGVLTEQVREAVARIAERHPDVLFFADSRAFIDRFRGVTIKCNNLEAARMTGRPVDEERFDPDEVFASMDELEARTGRAAVVTCNRHGIAVKSDGRRLLVPAVRHSGPIDICGAGDASTAGLVSALCAGATMAEAACVGNLAAGVTVRKLGQTGTASREEMVAVYMEGER